MSRVDLVLNFSKSEKNTWRPTVYKTNTMCDILLTCHCCSDHCKSLIIKMQKLQLNNRQKYVHANALRIHFAIKQPISISKWYIVPWVQNNNLLWREWAELLIRNFEGYDTGDESILKIYISVILFHIDFWATPWEKWLLENAIYKGADQIRTGWSAPLSFAIWMFDSCTRYLQHFLDCD